MKNYNDLTFDERLAGISLYPEEAKKDENLLIRREAYRTLGYTEEAKNDEYWGIRLYAYQALGFTKEAKRDENEYIREQAKTYFKIKTR